MYCLVISAGLHLSNYIHRIYYIMEYCISLPSKHFVIVLNSIPAMFRG